MNGTMNKEMTDISKTLDQVITAGDEIVGALKETVGASEAILTAIKELRELFSNEDGVTDKERAASLPESKEGPAPVPAPVPASEAKSAPDSKTYSFTDVRGIMAGLSGTDKKEKARAILKKFGANRLSEVKPEDYAALVAEAEVIANG